MASGNFALLIMRVVFFLVLFIVVVSIALHHDAFQSIPFAVAPAVGLTPSSFPMITSITLGQEARLRMAKRKVIVKHLPAIQNLGSMDVLCSDKTGTLTTGNMMLTKRRLIRWDEPLRPHLGARVAKLAHFETRNSQSAGCPRSCSNSPRTESYEKCECHPFDFERPALVDSGCAPDFTSEQLLITKELPRGMLDASAAWALDGQLKAPLTGDLQSRHRIYEEQREERVQGVLAVAYRKFQDRDAPCTIPDESWTDAGGILDIRRSASWGHNAPRNPSPGSSTATGAGEDRDW